MASLRVEVERFVAETATLETLLSQTEALSPAHQKLIAELIIVKLAVAFENCISQGLYRIVAGQPDLSGAVVARHTTPNTIAAAKAQLLAGAQRTPWLNASEVCASLQKVVENNDPMLERIRRHGPTVSAIRKIRNHIAHRNRNSSLKFRDLVLQVYGARLNHISPGTLLLTRRIGPKPLCLRLVIASRIAVSEIFSR
jgi:hypothetical protein